MKMSVTFRPLIEWPNPVTRHRSARRFVGGWNDTMEILDKELRALSAKNLVIQIETTERWLRNDGWPASNAVVNGPKVAITFDSKFGVLTYRCDYCATWIHNVRCIALTLERLRMAELYGVTKRGEQYAGFKALPASIQVDAMGQDEALKVLITASGLADGQITNESLATAYRLAAKRTHPDTPCGNEAAFLRVQAAFDTLKRQWGIG